MPRLTWVSTYLIQRHRLFVPCTKLLCSCGFRDADFILCLFASLRFDVQVLKKCGLAFGLVGTNLHVLCTPGTISNSTQAETPKAASWKEVGLPITSVT